MILMFAVKSIRHGDSTAFAVMERLGCAAEDAAAQDDG
jgi:hypothetical protein